MAAALGGDAGHYPAPALRRLDIIPRPTLSPFAQLLIALACFGLWMMTLVMTYRLEAAMRAHAMQMNALARANNNLAWTLDPHAFDEELRRLTEPPVERPL